MKPFIGRTRELADLEATARLPGAKFIVIKGRRRVGKKIRRLSVLLSKLGK